MLTSHREKHDPFFVWSIEGLSCVCDIAQICQKETEKTNKANLGAENALFVSAAEKSTLKRKTTIHEFEIREK